MYAKTSDDYAYQDYRAKDKCFRQLEHNKRTSDATTRHVINQKHHQVPFGKSCKRGLGGNEDVLVFEREEQPSFKLYEYTQVFNDEAPATTGADSRIHKFILALDRIISRLHENPTAVLKTSFDVLLHHTFTHIREEEYFMKLVRYASVYAHYKHDRLIYERTVQLKDCADNNCLLTMSTEQIESLRSLWIEHIDEYDRNYEKFLMK